MKKRSPRECGPETFVREGMDGQTAWRLASRAATGAERLVVDFVSFVPGGRHRLHRHPHAEQVTYVLEGTAEVLTDRGSFVMTAGEALHIPAGEWHGLANPGDTPMTILSIWGNIADPTEAGYEDHPSVL